MVAWVSRARKAGNDRPVRTPVRTSDSASLAFRERLGSGCDVVAGSRAIIAFIDRRLGLDDL
jgi:hypothetical protein